MRAKYKINPSCALPHKYVLHQLTTRHKSQAPSSYSVCFNTSESSSSPNQTTWGLNNPPQSGWVQWGKWDSGICASGVSTSGALK